MAEPLPSWDTRDVESLREFSFIRLIVADLDGTFMEPKAKNISDTLEYLRRNLSHQRYHVDLTIATGRTLAGVRSILRKLQLPTHIPLILYNGSVVIHNKSLVPILHRTIESKTLQRMLRVLERFPIRAYAYVFSHLIGDDFRMIEDIEIVLGWSKCGRPQFEFNGLKVKWQRGFILNDNVNPAAVVIEAPSDPKALILVAQCLSDIEGITITKSSLSFLEIRPEGSNKGTGLAAAAKVLRLQRDNLLALGDSDNDVEMLSWAGKGVAIAGASEAALAASAYVCRHGVIQGAVEVLRLVKHARRYFFQPDQTVAKEH